MKYIFMFLIFCSCQSERLPMQNEKAIYGFERICAEQYAQVICINITSSNHHELSCVCSNEL
jgi:hypothetical protein